MVHVSLAYRNGDQKGQSVRIDQDEFLIGRKEDSNLCLPSRSVSRRHCVLVRRNEVVAIIDLGSRNPTLVNGEPLAKKKPRRLYDRDKIQIGRIKFRLLVQDEQTGDKPTNDKQTRDQPTGDLVRRIAPPLRSGNASDDDHDWSSDLLLDELDEIAATFSGKDLLSVAFQPHVQETTEVGAQDESIRKPTRGSDAAEEDADLANATTVSIDSEEMKTSMEDVDDDSDKVDSKASGPKRLPDHLRPKGPADSQGAADLALRNMFNRRT